MLLQENTRLLEVERLSHYVKADYDRIRRDFDDLSKQIRVIFACLYWGSTSDNGSF